jgi:hypothetical protein
MIHHATLATRLEDIDDAVAFWGVLGLTRPDRVMYSLLLRDPSVRDEAP